MELNLMQLQPVPDPSIQSKTVHPGRRQRVEASCDYNPFSLERQLLEAEQQARRFNHAVAVCLTIKDSGITEYWTWPFQMALAHFECKIVAVALYGTHPGAKEKHSQNDIKAAANFSDWK